MGGKKEIHQAVRFFHGPIQLKAVKWI